VPVDSVLGNMQVTVIDMQCNGGLKEQYIYVGLFGLYSKYIDVNTFPEVHSHALFGNTYFCEQCFSGMKNVKSKTRTKITNTNLENSL